MNPLQDLGTGGKGKNNMFCHLRTIVVKYETLSVEGEVREEAPHSLEGSGRDSGPRMESAVLAFTKENKRRLA